MHFLFGGLFKVVDLASSRVRSSSQDFGDCQPFRLALGLYPLGESQFHLAVFLEDQVVLEQTVDQTFTELLEQASAEIDGLSLPVDKAQRGTLDGEDVGDVEVSPDGDASTIFFVLLDFEAAAEEAKHLCALAHEFRDRSDLHVLAAVQWEVGAVHEYRLPPRVRVDI